MRSQFQLVVRMITPILAISLLPLMAGIGAAWYVHQSHRHASDSLARNTLSMRAAEELAIGIRDVQAQLYRFLLTGNSKHLDAVSKLRQETNDWLATARRAAVTSEERTLIARVQHGYEHFFEEYHKTVHDVPITSVSPRAQELIKDALTREILLPAQEYLDFNEEEITRSNKANQAVADQMVVGLLLLGICGPVSGLLAGFGIARGVSRSIVRLSVPIRDAAGKLNEIVGPLTLSAEWGLEELESMLHTMAAQVGAVVERLQQSQREVLRAEQLAGIGQLAAGMAHELRNPLMAMKILVQSASDYQEGRGLQGRDLIVLEEEITRLERTIQTFLDFARPPKLEKRTFEARNILEQVIGLLMGRIERQGACIQCELPDQPILIRADVGQIRQVLLNLLLNALDALSPGGTVRVTMTLNGPALPPDKKNRENWLVLCVSDTGCGLPPQLGATIFDPFVSTKETGTGLGLSICKRIVEAHGGAIHGDNGADGGAVFTVQLPLSGADESGRSPGDDYNSSSSLDPK